MAKCPKCKDEIAWKQFNRDNICEHCSTRYTATGKSAMSLIVGGAAYIFLMYGLLLRWKIDPHYIRGAEFFWWTYESVLFVAGFMAWCFLWENAWWRRIARLKVVDASHIYLEKIIPMPMALGMLVFFSTSLVLVILRI